MIEETINAIGFGGSAPFDFVAELTLTDRDGKRLSFNTSLIKRVYLSKQTHIILFAKPGIEKLYDIFIAGQLYDAEFAFLNARGEVIIYRGKVRVPQWPFSSNMDGGLTTIISFATMEQFTIEVLGHYERETYIR